MQRLNPLSNYSFGVKEIQAELNPENKLEAEYSEKGQRTTVEGVLLVHEHNHPHILLLQSGQSYQLPGDTLKMGEDEIEGLKARLNSKLSAPGEDPNGFEIKELVATWYRPNFDVPMYPYCPPHIKKPKEIRNIYLVQMPPKKLLSVPKNLNLIAVPLFELYANASQYGPQLAMLPIALSRFKFFYD